MTLCCLCHARGIERRAAPVKVGVPLCAECRTSTARGDGGSALAVDQGTDSAAVLRRYAARLTLAGGLATMATRGTA